MPRFLNGRDLAEHVMERQRKQVENLRLQFKIVPKLVIIMSKKHAKPESEVYIRMKQKYAEQIGVIVDVILVEEFQMKQKIEELNQDETVFGVMVQLPVNLNFEETNQILKAISPKKDVDGLNPDQDSVFLPATVEAVDWLLSGYNVTMQDKKITIVGQGRLVGKPLLKLWEKYNPTAVDKNTRNIDDILQKSDIIVSATGVASLIKSKHLKKKAVLVDAGTVEDNGTIVGDADEEVFERKDIVCTPKKGGLGPMTVCVMIDHVVQSAFLSLEKEEL